MIGLSKIKKVGSAGEEEDLLFYDGFLSMVAYRFSAASTALK